MLDGCSLKDSSIWMRRNVSRFCSNTSTMSGSKCVPRSDRMIFTASSWVSASL